jgi:hypothetical protein
MSYSGGSGSWGFATGYPTIYDTFTRDGSGNQLINTSVYPNPSTALGSALTSDNIWFHGSNAMAANVGVRVKMYAPSTWSSGSSYSHLDYTTFNNTVNQLMVYAISSGESIHDPGPVTKGLLKDLGWQPVQKQVDFDGDWKTDVAIYRQSTGVWFMVPSSGAARYAVSWGGNASDIPVAGDYDGDGKTDMAIYRKSTGVWFIVPSKGAAAYAVSWGGDGSDIPVAGDYDGDGKTDIAIYRKSTGVWFIKPSSGAAPYAVSWGGDPSDIPVPGDYDGDGKTDIAIYRKGTGVWFIIPSSGAARYAVGWGGDGSDVPITNNRASY